MNIAEHVAIVAVLVLSVIALACGSGSDSGDTPTSSGVSGAQPNLADAATGKVSANNATDEELEAAVEAVGIPNASRWRARWKNTVRTRWTTPTSPCTPND